jgi:hypothetical protein
MPWDPSNPSHGFDESSGEERREAIYDYLSGASKKMEREDEILELSILVNDGLRGYVGIHNYLFRPSLRRIIPFPFFFVPIDVNTALEAGDLAAQGLQKCANICNNMMFSATSDEQIYLELVLKYVGRVIKTISCLKTVLQGLCKKLDGQRYGWRDYRRDIRKYKNSIDQYTALGPAMNQQYRELVATRFVRFQ